MVSQLLYKGIDTLCMLILRTIQLCILALLLSILSDSCFFFSQFWTGLNILDLWKSKESMGVCRESK